MSDYPDNLIDKLYVTPASQLNDKDLTRRVVDRYMGTGTLLYLMAPVVGLLLVMAGEATAVILVICWVVLPLLGTLHWILASRSAHRMSRDEKLEFLRRDAEFRQEDHPV